MRRPIVIVLLSVSIVSSALAVHAASATGQSVDTHCWDEYNLRGSRKLGTMVPAGSSTSDCTPGSGCWYGFRASDGKRNKWFVPYGMDPQSACAPTTTSTATTPEATTPDTTTSPETTTGETTNTETTTGETTNSPETTTGDTTFAGTTPLPGDAQFLATFETAADLDLFDWAVLHGSPNDPRLTPTWQGDHDHSCGSPATLREVTQVPNNVAPGPVANVGDLVWWCGPNPSSPTMDAHIMTSLFTTGYGHLDFSPRRTFTDVQRVCWDQNYTQMGRKWTQMSIIPEALFQRNGGGLAYGRVDLQDAVAAAAHRVTGDAWMLDTGAGSSTVQLGQEVVYQNFDTGGLLGSQDKGRRYRNCAIDRGDGTVRLELERSGGTEIRIAPGSFPDGAVRVIFQDVTYDASKGPAFERVLQQNTWHWDNIGVW